MTTSPKKNNSMLWIFIAVAGIVIIGSIILVLNQGMKQPESSTQDGALEFSEAQGNLSIGEDTSVSMENITVHVPGSNITVDGNLVITIREPSLQPTAQKEDWDFYQVVNVEYRDAQDPSITYVEFDEPLKVCFGVTDEQWEIFNTTPENVVVQRYTEETQVWEPLQTMGQEENHQICGITEHLCLFALCFKPGDGGPEPTPTEGGPYEP